MSNDVENSVERGMQSCKLTITTAVDGRETEFSCQGELVLSARKAILRYRQEEASIELYLDGQSAKIEREGDYSLSFCLQSGMETKGKLSFGCNDGEMNVFTHRVAYSIGKDSLLASLHYDLLFGEERQEMKLRILARYI
jgi:uncharacterized beta-barrel protein YwiB (DUF1934 family)